jgi:hypothetical protein
MLPIDSLGLRGSLAAQPTLSAALGRKAPMAALAAEPFMRAVILCGAAPSTSSPRTGAHQRRFLKQYPLKALIYSKKKWLNRRHLAIKFTCASVNVPKQVPMVAN